MRKVSEFEKKDIKVSVIVCCHNAEKTVDRCINSLIAQTLEDIEIVCVNDGSRDNTQDILERYAGEETGIKTVTQRSQGMSYARNAGLKAGLSGKYIYFLTGEDYLEPYALEQLYSYSKKNKLDILLFSADSEVEDTVKDRYKGVYSGTDIMCAMIENGYFDFSIKQCFFSKALLSDNNLYFDDLGTCQDEYFVFQAMLCAGRVSCSEETVCCSCGYKNADPDGSFIDSYSNYLCFQSVTDKLKTINTVEESKYQLLLMYACDKLFHSRKIYANLRNEEKNYIHALNLYDRTLYGIAVKDSVEMQNNFDKIKNSRAYRIGSSITVPVKLVRNQFRNETKVVKTSDRKEAQLLNRNSPFLVRVRKSMEEADNEPASVNIMCMVYNHGPYLREALDGMLMQKTDFPFNIIVHDDASTDDSAEIIKEYYENYPQIIIPLLEEENQFVQCKLRLPFIFSHFKAKYISWCEGDDFWTDENKLQKQIGFLEKHPEYSACYTNILPVGKDGLYNEDLRHIYKYVEEGDYTETEIKDAHLYTHLASLAGRNFFRFMDDDEIRDYLRPQINGDVKLLMMFGHLGKVHYLSDVTAAHRRVINEGDSWTAREKRKTAMQRLESKKTLLTSRKQFISRFFDE